MKLTLETLLTANQSIVQLANTRGMKSIVAYRISKNFKLVEGELKNYDETRIKLLEEHSKKDKEGKAIIKNNAYDIIAGHMEIVDKELNELKKEIIDLDIKKISLKDIEIAGLAPVELTALEFMIDFEEEEEK